MSTERYRFKDYAKYGPGQQTTLAVFDQQYKRASEPRSFNASQSSTSSLPR